MRRSIIPSLSVLVVTVHTLLPATSARAHGGPPLITDDPGTPGNGKWEINIPFTFARTPRKKTFEAPRLDFNYGWGDHVQVKYEVAYTIVDERERGTHTGVGDSLIGYKWRFIDEDQHGFAMSIYPQLEFNTPPGVERRGVEESGANFFLPIEIGKTIGPFELAAEVGYEFVQHDKDQWEYGVVVGYPATKKLELLGEIHGNVDQNFHRNDLIINVGARWELNDTITLLVSAGRSLRSSDDSPTLLIYAGLRFNL
jgi:hypothetical protein